MANKMQMTKDQIRWCIKQGICKNCFKQKDCIYKKIVEKEKRDKFIHIDIRRK